MIAEAAVIFPIIILSMMAILCILIRMYIGASESIHSHLALRMEAGIRTNTVLREEGFRNLIPDDRFGKSAFSIDPEIEDAGKIIDNYIFAGQDRSYIIDEASYIRKSDLIKGMMD